VSGMMNAGAAWRHLRSDRSALDKRVGRATLRRVLGFAVPHRRTISVFLALTVVDASLVVASPLLVQRIVDDGILDGDRSLVAWLALAMAGLAVFTAGMSILLAWLSARIGEGLIYDLRTQVFGHVQRQSMAFFTRTQTGALVSRLNNDVIGAQRAFTSTLSTTVSNAVAVLVVGITMLALSWRVTLLCLALFPLLMVASKWVSTRLAGLTRQQMDGNADLGNMMTERFNVGGALLLKLFGRRDEEDETFASKAGRVRDLGVRITLTTRVFGAAMLAVPALATALVYGVGGQLAISGTLSVGTLLALATLLLRLLGPLQGLSNVRIDVMTALVSFERVFEVLDLPSLVQEKDDAVDLPRTAAHCGQAVGHRHAQVVVIVGREDHMTGPRDIGGQVREQRVDFFRRGIAHRVGHVEHVGPCGGGAFQRFLEERGVGAQRVFGGKLDFGKAALGHTQRTLDRGERFGLFHLVLGGQMQVAGAKEQVQPAAARRPQRPLGSVDIAFGAPRQRAQ